MKKPILFQIQESMIPWKSKTHFNTANDADELKAHLTTKHAINKMIKAVKAGIK